MTPSVRPNLIIILCDDLGYGDVGALTPDRDGGGRRPVIGTPCLDRMAEDGLVLEGLYCSAPVCAPSRASLLTGLTQGHSDLRDNSFDQALEDVPTVGTVARHAGYSTAAIGKWGVQGKEGSSPADWEGYPTRRGFDTFYGYARHSDGHEHYPADGLYRGKKQVWHDDVEVSDDLAGCYTTDLFTARAKKWIVEQDALNPDQPFLLYLAYDTPHAVAELPAGPYPAGRGLNGGVQWLGASGCVINSADGQPDSYCHPDYAESGWPDVYRRYATSVRRIDDAVGDILALLVDLGIQDETIVLFTSDNGPSIESYLDEPLRADFFESYGPFDGIKRDCWEGGVRVGGLVWGPGIVPPGRVSAEPMQFQDLLPTVCEFTGAPVPAHADGVSLVPLFTGVGKQEPSTVYVEYAHDGRTPDYEAFDASHRNRMRGQMQVVRLGDHLGVRYDIQDHEDPFQIYNIVDDPKQVNDLGSGFEEMQVRMHAEALRGRMPHPDRPRPYDGCPVAALSAPVETGIRMRVYAGEFPWVPRFDDRTTPISATTIEERIDDGPTSDDGVGARIYTGQLELSDDAVCRFTISEVVGAVFRIHRASVIAADHLEAGSSASGTIRLARGVHPYMLSVRGVRSPRLAWSATSMADADGDCRIDGLSSFAAESEK